MGAHLVLSVQPRYQRLHAQGAFIFLLASVGAWRRHHTIVAPVVRHAVPTMGAKRVLFWRAPPERRVLASYLTLSKAASIRLNVTDAVETRWSAEVVLRKKQNEPDAPGMFTSLTASGVAEEVFHVTLDAPVERDTGVDTSVDTNPPRSVLVLRGEKKCIEGSVKVKEYFSRCKTHRLEHKARVDGVQFYAGDFAVRVGNVENMQGSYTGTVVEVEYVPVSSAKGAEAALREYASHVEKAFQDAEKENGGSNAKDNTQGELVPVATEQVLAHFGLEDVAFGDQAQAALYVTCIMKMQS